MNAFDIVTAVLVLGGSTLVLTGAIGVVRFPDTLSRMHAATKPQVLGLLLVLALSLPLTLIRHLLDLAPDGICRHPITRDFGRSDLFRQAAEEIARIFQDRP